MSVSAFYPLVPSGLQPPQGLDLSDDLVLDADHCVSLQGYLLMLMSRLHPLFVQLSQKTKEHLDELALGGESSSMSVAARGQ